MSVVATAIVIGFAMIAMVAAVALTLADYGSEIIRAWRMETLPPRGDSFRVRRIRQPLVSPSGRSAPLRHSFNRSAA